MKQILLALLIAGGSSLTALAQCDKKFNLATDKVFQLNADSTEGEAIPGTATIMLSKDSIHVVMNMNDGTSFELKGLQKQMVCKMNADYSEGTIDLVYDAVLYARGNEKNDKLFFTVTCKAGSMKLVGAPESNMEDKICFVIKDRKEIK